MSKTILLTGATDGIGLETAKRLAADGHHLLVHGRSGAKLKQLQETLAGIAGAGAVETLQAALSVIPEVVSMCATVAERRSKLDVLINNAGVLGTPDTRTPEGLDIRFVVNTIAPWVLTQRMLPLLGSAGRVVNLSSAAQSPVNMDLLHGKVAADTDMDAYAQSKLAITSWSRHLALSLVPDGTMVVAVNPGSLLASKMVKEAFNMAGNDIGIGADILVRAALSDEFADASGKYFDNDAGGFGPPHADVMDAEKSAVLTRAVAALAEGLV